MGSVPVGSRITPPGARLRHRRRRDRCNSIWSHVLRYAGLCLRGILRSGCPALSHVRCGRLHCGQGSTYPLIPIHVSETHGYVIFGTVFEWAVRIWFRCMDIPIGKRRSGWSLELHRLPYCHEISSFPAMFRTDTYLLVVSLAI
jgi:hypothetical protein